jgi:flagellar biosynthesis/type III secretory pathway protein FliH
MKLEEQCKHTHAFKCSHGYWNCPDCFEVLDKEPENKSTNEEWRYFHRYSDGTNGMSQAWDELNTYEQAKVIIQKLSQAEEKGYQRGIEEGRKIGYADCLEKHEII